MTNTRCVFNAASALSRVFIAPVEHSPSQFLRSPNFCVKSLLKFNATPIQRRTVFKTTSNVVPEKRLPRDEEITAPYLRLKNAEQGLESPRSTADILRTLNLKTHRLQVMTWGEDGEAPIARIIDKKEAHVRKKMVKSMKKPVAVVKTIEMNWAIENNDLGHRLEKMREFLEKGNKVEVLLAGKKKGRKAMVEEAEEVLKRIREFADGIDGGKPPAKDDENEASAVKVVKMLDMNWAIEQEMLGHRLKKIRDFLEKGYAVEVFLDGKKKGKQATQDEAEEVIRRIDEAVEGVEGAMESRKMEGVVGAQVLLCFGGKIPTKDDGKGVDGKEEGGNEDSVKNESGQEDNAQEESAQEEIGQEDNEQKESDSEKRERMRKRRGWIKKETEQEKIEMEAEV
ncbi:hypothetical protein SBOR_3044 [Sclerotinia borealis F-4128]|uniref:Translation initiation factor 3 N-terminal domain-containing protein n=1 Tax=Sclerotinia borealis (strain F-4128) TaxID=1432307 RepID=W9CIF7_SCLBF|nr:hypothetical protein SBOR_3044 [Sclerotinia borealis F-4128]